jgi:hypothetical protein
LQEKRKLAEIEMAKDKSASSLVAKQLESNKKFDTLKASILAKVKGFGLSSCLKNNNL